MARSKSTRSIYILTTLVAAIGALAIVWRLRPAARDKRVADAESISATTYSAPLAQELAKRKAALAKHPKDASALRALAQLYLANRLYSEARAVYTQLAVFPDGLTAQDHYYLAEIAQQTNALEEAIAELRKVIQGAPNYLPARLALAQALFKTGQTEVAKNEFAACLTLAPAQPDASIGLAKLKLQEHDQDGAVQILEELMAAHPESVDGAALIGPLLQRRGEVDRAAAFAQIAQQKPPPPMPDPWAASLLADCYDPQRLSLLIEDDLRVGQRDEATRLLERLSQIDADNPNVYIFQGLLRAESRDFAGAAQLYRQAIALHGDPEKIAPVLTASLLALGKTDEAVPLLAQWHAKLPDSNPIAKAYATIAVQRGDDKTAEPLLVSVLAKEPFLKSENMALAKIYWESGRRDQAAECLKRVATAFGDDVPSRALLAEYYFSQANPGRAVELIEQAVKHVSPNSDERESLMETLAASRIQLGQADAKAGRFADAKAQFDRAIAASPNRVEGYAAKADVCVELHDYVAATGALKKMAALQPKNPTIYLTLGDVYHQQGDHAQARQHWQQAERLAPAADSSLKQALAERLQRPIEAK